MRKFLFCFVLLLVVAIPSFGQKLTGEKPIACTSYNLRQGRYKILSISHGVELQVYLEISRKFRTNNNYIAIAKEFKERFCRENQLRVIYLTGKKQWLIRDYSNIAATPLAIFSVGKNSGESEGIFVYKITDGKVETSKLDF